jgi:predicted transcriptional regulator
LSRDEFYDVIFEFSNEERVKMMKALTTERTSFSGLARSLGITTQEVSRHFNRLVESGLATRDTDGYPCLTPYGLMMLRQLGDIMFTTSTGSILSPMMLPFCLTSFWDVWVSSLG